MNKLDYLDLEIRNYQRKKAKVEEHLLTCVVQSHNTSHSLTGTPCENTLVDFLCALSKNLKIQSENVDSKLTDILGFLAGRINRGSVAVDYIKDLLETLVEQQKTLSGQLTSLRQLVEYKQPHHVELETKSSILKLQHSVAYIQSALVGVQNELDYIKAKVSE